MISLTALVLIFYESNHRLHKFRKLRLEKYYKSHYLCNPLYLQICLIRLPLKFSTHFWIVYVILGVVVSYKSNLLNKYTYENSNYKEGATKSFNTTEPKMKMASTEDLRKALSVEHFKVDPSDLNVLSSQSARRRFRQ